MTTASYAITGGDFDRAGLATSDLKRRLKTLGVEPEAVRRVVIAVYEAEANVVVHAHKGTLRAMLGPTQIDVEVTDEGPGIHDVALAMTEGFSTASAAARALGFGAGMGLPNIQKNSGSFEIQSKPGRGTRLHFSIPLRRFEAAAAARRNSVHVRKELCTECMRCLHVCPTKALRIRRGGPEILEHLCIDCAACIEACKAGALGVPDGALPAPSERGLLVLPAALLVGFGPEVGPHDVLRALTAVGFDDVRVAEPWEAALHEATLAYAGQQASVRPVVSPACPAVVNLVQTRFPSLLPLVAPFLSPVEAAAAAWTSRAAAVGVSCPAQHTALSTGGPSGPVPLSLSRLRDAVLPTAFRHRGTSPPPPDELGRAEACEPGVLRATGLRHVIEVLDKAESGLLGDVVLLELFACDGGCFGSPLYPEVPSIARYRWLRVRGEFAAPAEAVRREVPLTVQPGMRLDEDMGRAIEKLHQIDLVAADLPGKDCGMCGAPTCVAMAEDLVLGRAAGTRCPHQAKSTEEAT